MKSIFIVFMGILSLFGADLSVQSFVLTQTNKKEAKLLVPHLPIGQSGVVVARSGSNSVVISYGIVSATDGNSTTITFDPREIIAQNAIPKTKLRPKDGDIFILGHLYKNSIIIAPNYEALKEVEKIKSSYSFVESDLFGAFLKIENTPAPKKETFLDFAHKNDLGIFHIVIDETLYTVDALSFIVVNKEPISYKNKATISPFYTNVEDIKTSTFSFFEEESIGEYHAYYKKLLGIHDGK